MVLAECLRILFPQWQGSGREKYLYYSAIEIRDNFLPEFCYEQIDVDLEDEFTIKNDILGYDSIMLQLKKAVHLLSESKPNKIFTIGGDCGVELAPVSYLNRYYNGDLAVIWFDAHGDLNTPLVSPSKNFHGMPLRSLLGDGDENIIGQCFSSLVPNQIILVGCRELDLPEKEYICENNIQIFSANEMKDLDLFIHAVRAKGFSNLYVHLDLDVLDPECFPAVMCSAGNGITLENLMRSLKILKKQFNLVGFSTVEYKQNNDECMEKLREIIEYGYSL